jgi:phosphoribosyl-ATP pyrophosphohydrolase
MRFQLPGSSLSLAIAQDRSNIVLVGGRNHSTSIAFRHVAFFRKYQFSPMSQPSDSQHLETLSRVMQTLRERAEQLPEGSYTTKLLRGGPEKIGEKLLEESRELIEAASESGPEGRDHFVYEAGDLIYHTLVMLAWRGVDLDEVAAELARREGTSGLVEKASRKVQD